MRVIHAVSTALAVALDILHSLLILFGVSVSSCGIACENPTSPSSIQVSSSEMSHTPETIVARMLPYSSVVFPFLVGPVVGSSAARGPGAS
jgi:hypothetical protein